MIEKVVDRLDTISEQIDTLIEAVRNIGGTRTYDELDLGDDDQRQSGLGNLTGVRVEVTEDAREISGRLSPRTRGVTTAYLKEHTDPDDDPGDVLATADIRDLQPGEWFHLEAELEAGETYEVVVDAADEDGEQRNFIRGRRNDVDYPIEGDGLVATGGIYGNDGAYSESHRYSIDRLQLGEDFSNRERAFGPLDDVPEDAEIIDVESHDAIDEDGDLAAELESFCESVGTVNHAFILPDRARWSSMLDIDRGEFLGLIGYGSVLDVDRPLDLAFRLGHRRGSLDEIIVRGVALDITGSRSGTQIDTGFAMMWPAEVGIFEDLELVGQRYRYQDLGNGLESVGNRFTFLLETVGAGGVSVVNDLRMLDGDEETSEHQVGHAIACAADPSSVGRNVWVDVELEDWVDNGMYVANSPGYNEVVRCFVRNCAGSSVRLAENDSAHGPVIVFDDMSGRKPGSGLWFQGGTPFAEDVTIDAPDGNHELVRCSSDADGGRIEGLDVYAGPGNQHHTMRANGSGRLVVEDIDVLDESSGTTLSDIDASITCRRPTTLRRGQIEIADSCPRPAIHGDPDLEDVDILE